MVAFRNNIAYLEIFFTTNKGQLMMLIIWLLGYLGAKVNKIAGLILIVKNWAYIRIQEAHIAQIPKKSWIRKCLIAL